MKSVRTLYLCYFGLREPLVQTQVLPYLRELASAGLEIYLLTFEPKLQQRWPAPALADEQARLQGDGIAWSALPYHKTPSGPATLYDIAAGALAAVRLVRRHGIHVLHARAHIPLAMALITGRLTGCAIVFDIRGLMAEEYADAGVWAADSLKFRVIKKLEKVGVSRANQLVVLTRSMKKWLLSNHVKEADAIEVIPCCVDFARYTGAAARFEAAIEAFEVVYAGSVTGLYMLEEMGRFFMALRAREPRAFLRILTTSSAAEAGGRLQRVGLTPAEFWIGGVSAPQVPRYLERARLGLSFRKPTFSQLAASPTKIAEYLAAGLPVVSNAGIGDVDELLEQENVGVLVRDFTPESLASAAVRALELASEADVRIHCVEVARRHFDLKTVGAEGYTRVYRRIERTLNAR